MSSARDDAILIRVNDTLACALLFAQIGKDSVMN